MPELIELLQSIGETPLEPFWLPVFIWTIIAVPAALIFRSFDSIPPVYQYYSRVALLLALPAGVAGSITTGILSNTSGTTEALTTKFIVLQNPLTATAASAGSAPIWSSALSNPMLWVGLLNLILALGALYLLSSFLIKVIQLRMFERRLSYRTVKEIPELGSFLPDEHLKRFGNTLVAYSPDSRIPFTFGWFKTRIVIPAVIKKSPEKMAMAVQHELMHIKNRDYLMNCLFLITKYLFWFHPLVHYLYRSGQDYREITCDSEVLAGECFSRRKYATLLVELAEQEYTRNSVALSMAVKPSTLKKRIQMMSKPNKTVSTGRNIISTVVTILLITGVMACTDLRENGITHTELEEVQADIYNKSDENAPLYVIDGEIDSKYSQALISSIKPKYIQSIQIYKDQKAVELYGEAGKNGVVEIELKDKEKAFADLESPPPPVPGTSSSGTDSGDSDKAGPPPPEESFFVAVEQMPELVGGIASLQTHIRYPEEARQAGVEGRVIVQFIVNEQGEVENPQIIRGIGAGCDEEALRVVKQAKFKPGKQRGQPVPVQYSLPIVYRLQDNPNTQ